MEFRNNKLRENAWLAVSTEIDAKDIRIILRGKIDHSVNSYSSHSVNGDKCKKNVRV